MLGLSQSLAFFYDLCASDDDGLDMDAELVSEAPAITLENKKDEGVPGLSDSKSSSNHDRPVSSMALEQQCKETMEQSGTPIACPQDDNTRKQLSQIHESIPPLKAGEYNVLLPITSSGLLITLHELEKNTAAFSNYRAFPDGTEGPAQKNKLIRNKGDRIIMINGERTENKPIEDIVEMLRRACSEGLCYVRFLDITVDT